MESVEVEFAYEGLKVTLYIHRDDSIRTAINLFKKKLNLNIDDLYFLCNGRSINENEMDKKISYLCKDFQYNKIMILVCGRPDKNEFDYNNKSNDIICPKCKEICKYEIRDYRIKLYGCKKEHIVNNIKLDEYMNTQNIDLSKIKCDQCNSQTKLNTFNNVFYICLDCKKNLCPLCRFKHDNKHRIINYDDKNYICYKHNEKFRNYCKDCNMNICSLCIKEHTNHMILPYWNMFINIENIRRNINILKEVIKTFKTNSEIIITKIKKIMDNMDIFYRINNDFLNKYKENHISYQTLNNLIEINRSITNEIDNIRYKYNFGYNLNQLLYLYTEMNDKNLEIDLNYKPKEDNKNKVRIFGKNFVSNNMQKCKILYNGNEYDLKEYLEDIDNKYNNKDSVLIKLKGINNITDMSYMFYGCNSLSLISDVSIWNTSNVTNMGYIFDGCSSLSSLPDISKWNTNNVINMKYMFRECNSLLSLPDISKWNISKVYNMDSIFRGCNSLLEFPDISKWDTFNLTNIKHMFRRCESIKYLPDVSKWNTSNITDMTFVFSECKSLLRLPDISKWNTSNVINMRSMFSGCKKLYSLPDISSWDTSKVTSMNSMFSECSSLQSLPNISKWNIVNVKDKNDMFKECQNSLNIPKKFK